MHKILFLTGMGILLAWVSFGQTVRGRVEDEKTGKPVPFVSVYVNNTTIGALTDEKGAFSLQVKPGRHELVVSSVGYEPLIYALEGTPPGALVFRLRQKETVLATVSVKAKRDASWYENLRLFKDHFLGRSKFATSCRIRNENKLVIFFDAEKGVLQVKCDEPLEIENPELGYTIVYLLTEFQADLRGGYTSFLGYPNFRPMTGGKAKQRRWARRREEAYRGSAMHFVRALRQRRLEQEGFNLRRLLRIPNPNRPTEAELQAVRDRIRAGNILRPDDRDQQLLSKASLPKIIEKLDTARVSYDTYLVAGPEYRLAFEGYFQVVFTGEKEEEAYVAAQSMFRRRQPTFQTSVISLRNPVILEENGAFFEPLDVLFEGYWGWEKMGDMLPLDYGLR
ncbi:carboxypeptidase-like regulatory domain-containing protein [Siphonobacter aquaeclarae]|uniref:CarboxypepD_reg-like domain-containing protein n=1 Tax=Siphonobacter aquaeclarae TaxID=563176 RepID=A0A1G9PTC4_9BACT|nr:carboxypeptidase-like regulatory domain-containing protein [Siphonobacter aquaeclarae]SDM02034.1 CarboxypepD_reg-like domain-containing protein [Siphonobacter aquaeclarae]